MKHFIIFVINALLCTHFALSTEFSYDSRLATVVEYGNSRQKAVLDKQNNVYLFGTLSGLVDITPNLTYYTYWEQGYLAKYSSDPAHSLQWNISIVADLQSPWLFVAPLPDGQGVIVAATYWSFALLNNEACGGPSDADIFIARYSVDGTETWHRCFINSGSQYVTSLTVSDDNHIYTTGLLHTYGTINFGGATLGGFEKGTWIAKLDLDGNHVWSTAYENVIFGYGASKIYQDTFTIASALAGSTTIDGLFISYTPPAGAFGTIIIQVSALNGSCLWKQVISAESGTQVYDVDVDTQGSVTVVGASLGPLTLSPSIQLNQPSSLLIAKFDRTGNCLWANLYGSESYFSLDHALSSVRTGNDGTIFVSGKTCTDTNSCPLDLGGEIIPANGGFIAAFDPNGHHLWQSSFDAGSGSVIDTRVSPSHWTNNVLFTATVSGPTSMDNVAENAGTFVHDYKSSNPLAGLCAPCTSNYDCGNGRGTCVTLSNGSYCSCFSGFGGCDCSLDPSPACSANYSQVDALSGNFQADAKIDFNYPNLIITVEANLEESIFSNGDVNTLNVPPYSTETVIFFGSDHQWDVFSYPNGGQTWVAYPAEAGSCSNKYIATSTWSAYLGQGVFLPSPTESRLFSQTITIQRRYNLNGVVYRTEQTTRSLSVKFPSEIAVSTSNVSVSFPSSDAFAAITLIDYQPNTLQWTVQLQTSISSPYYLGTSSVASLTGNLADRNPAVNISACNMVDNYCVQTVTYSFGQGSLPDACLGLTGIDLHSFSVLCTTPSCPDPADVNVTLHLNTGNACPVTDTITFSEASLTSFDDAALSTPSRSFTINDKAYFGASVQTADAMISSRTLKSNSVCFQPPSGACFYPTYTIQTPTAGKDPVFMVDFQHPDNVAYFSSITEATQYSVNAVVQVDFAISKGMLKNLPQSQTIQTISYALVSPADETTKSSSVNVAPFVALYLALLALLLV